MSEICAHCSITCSLSCANCKKVSYCCKEHQKLNRKKHKGECFPAKLNWNQNLGNHLVATRLIQPGETIFEDEALVVGPRSNLPKLTQVCLGCCDLINEDQMYGCPDCGWSMCSPNCYKKYWHHDFECEIFSRNNVQFTLCEDEFLFVTILRCLLLKNKNPEIWEKFSLFEFHGESRQQLNSNSSVHSLNAVKFIQNTCNLKEFEGDLIDRIYGILTVNGYSDISKYFVKLYSLASEISHSCIPNTRSISIEGSMDSNPKLGVISTIPIQKNEPLTQLYANLLSGTLKRQELLQNIYHFTCSCIRCQDPTELDTHFSTLLCTHPKCKGQSSVLLAANPTDKSSTWKCSKCKNKSTYETLINSRLNQIATLTGISDTEPLYSEFEFYLEEFPDLPLPVNDESILLKKDHVIKIASIVEELGKTHVHPNHYALLPVNTAIVATIYSIIDKILDLKTRHILLKILLTTIKNLIGLFNILSPGMTRNRGIMLFYLAYATKLAISENPDLVTKNAKVEVEEVSMESKRILLLEPKSDTYRQLIENFSVI